jgi:hypothetical protein
VTAGRRTLGPIRVRTEPALVRAFGEAIGSAAFETGAVPITYPVSWLALLPLADLVPRGGAAIHEFQSFAYLEPLAPARDYVLTAVVELAPGSPARLRVDATVSEPSGRRLLEMSAGLLVLGAGETMSGFGP